VRLTIPTNSYSYLETMPHLLLEPADGLARRRPTGSPDSGFESVLWASCQSLNGFAESQVAALAMLGRSLSLRLESAISFLWPLVRNRGLLRAAKKKKGKRKKKIKKGRFSILEVRYTRWKSLPTYRIFQGREVMAELVDILLYPDRPASEQHQPRSIFCALRCASISFLYQSWRPRNSQAPPPRPRG